MAVTSSIQVKSFNRALGNPQIISRLSANGVAIFPSRDRK